jgi:hypothetical protein
VPPEPPAGSVAGSWVGDYVADPSDGFDCTGPATATFEQHEGAVSGVLDAAPPDCAFRDIRFEGRLEGTTLTGSMPACLGARTHVESSRGTPSISPS